VSALPSTTLAASQLVGLGMARHVLRVEPLASAKPADVVDWYAPTLQRYLTGKL
jgi:tetracycline repressor-like protein